MMIASERIYIYIYIYIVRVGAYAYFRYMYEDFIYVMKHYVTI